MKFLTRPAILASRASLAQERDTSRIPTCDFDHCQPRVRGTTCAPQIGMKTDHATAMFILCTVCLISMMRETLAAAERLPPSDLNSTLQSQCDLCWGPSLSESAPDRLPTHTYRRPRRPPDSRPRRIPKGGYTLTPHKKQTRSSLLRKRAQHNTDRLNGQQIRVIDGDTIRIGVERIRLRGIDTPEMNESDGQAAKERLEELLRGESVEIVPHGRDVYDRLVADVFVNGQNVAEILESEGLAKTK